MPSNKDRLYVALYARAGKPKMPGKEDTYHWAFIVGPKNESSESRGFRYHANEMPKLGQGSEFFYQESYYRNASNMLLVRIVVGKVTNRARLLEILRTNPVQNDEPGWNCVSWIRQGLEKLQSDNMALGTSVLDWETVRYEAMDYCQRKRDTRRFDGQGGHL
ncbi:uncharacterized protein N7483_005112 [Penicillium malachiteum]|uniref:uncharacterized protein n=1 Tax=Penicillium malachiteum TaxID=1324776 RepID=UPI002546CE01|nr:uncharacterized protein N7483_005112 [Penicillium malachiteum]KAJ5730604.1 hypothetical protein N7483_005112 [Penicillium malachiteum]